MIPSGRDCLGMGKSESTSTPDCTESNSLIAARSARKAHGSRELRRGAARHGAPIVTVLGSSLTTEIYNEFPVQPGRKFTRARDRARTDRGT